MATKCPKCHSENPSDSGFCSKCGTQLLWSEKIPSRTETFEKPSEELIRGTTFAGRYEIIEELGRGGMGKVYRVEDTKIKAEIALKLIKPEISSDKKTIERFSNELKTTRMISHRNVCRMFDLGEERGTYFITMEYVAGQDLRGLIRQTGQLTIGKAIAIAKQISEGLAEAHRLGVIHRDLKPSNIIIDKDGNARIMDFGIARSLYAKGLTGEGVIIGTPEYMSPEQVEGKEADQRSDIYSLGIILYEMVTGRTPFEGETPLSIAVKHKTEKPKDPKELNDQIPDDLSRLALRCLEKDKSRRYQSAEEVRSELENIEKGVPTTTHEIPKRKPLTSRQITVTFGAKKLLIPALGVAALAVIALVLWRFLPRHHTVPSLTGKPALAVLYFNNVSGDKSLDAWKTGLTELLITKLSQSRFIDVLDGTTIYSILKKLDLDEAKKYTKGDLQKVADEGGATHTLSGSLMKAGPNIIITFSLQKPRTGEVISSIPVECLGEQEIMSKMDEVATKIKADLDLSPQQIASDMDKEIGKITTASAEAYKYYSEARRFHLAQDYGPAIPLYEKAAAIDPTFAMAYRGLAAIYSNVGNVVRMREYIKKAMELSDRVSEKERLLIQGQYYYHLSEKTYDKAIEAFQKLLKLYPDDVFANQYLGEIYHDLEEPEKAKEYHMAAYKNAKEIIHIWNVYHDFLHLGQYDQARKIFEDNLRTISGDSSVPLYLGWNDLYQGRYELALSEADKTFLKSPDVQGTYILRGGVYLLQDNFAAAEKEFQTVVEEGQATWPIRAKANLAAVYQAQGQFEKAKEEFGQVIVLADTLGHKAFRAYSELGLAYLCLQTGRLGEALGEIEAASKIFLELDMADEQRIAMAMKGILYAEQGAMEKAQQTAEGLRKLVQESFNRKSIRYYDLLEGWIAWKKGNVSEAVENFKKAISLLPFQSASGDQHALFMAPLARAYEKAGDLDKAKAEYEKITLLTSGRLGYGDIYAKAHYMLGKIAEKQGNKVNAREHYQKFLDLWKDADPGLPEVEDARTRLARVMGAGPAGF